MTSPKALKGVYGMAVPLAWPVRLPSSSRKIWLNGAVHRTRCVVFTNVSWRVRTL